MIKFIEVAHLYYNVIGRYSNEWGTFTCPVSERLNRGSLEAEGFMPRLKLLSDISEDENAELLNLNPNASIPDLSFNSLGFRYLLDKGFDLFNLIETKQVIRLIPKSKTI